MFFKKIKIKNDTVTRRGRAADPPSRSHKRSEQPDVVGLPVQHGCKENLRSPNSRRNPSLLLLPHGPTSLPSSSRAPPPPSAHDAGVGRRGARPRLPVPRHRLLVLLVRHPAARSCGAEQALLQGGWFLASPGRFLLFAMTSE
jgi:hypothetical protein